MHHEFSSYADEFGHAQDPTKNFMGIAGLLAWSDDWRRFSEEWEQFMDDEKIPKPFHMVDFVHHNEKFSNARWENEDERMRILAHLLAIIERANAIPIAASVVLKDYNTLTVEQKTLCKSLYFLAFQAVTGNMGFATATINLEKKRLRAEYAIAEDTLLDLTEMSAIGTVSMVYAKLKKFTGPAEQLWNAIKAANMFGAWMGSYTSGEPKEHPPLQAADIWAYSIGHHGEHTSTMKVEAQKALEFFINCAMNAAHGAHWFTLLNKEEILVRIGQLPNLS